MWNEQQQRQSEEEEEEREWEAEEEEEEEQENKKKKQQQRKLERKKILFWHLVHNLQIDGDTNTNWMPPQSTKYSKFEKTMSEEAYLSDEEEEEQITAQQVICVQSPRFECDAVTNEPITRIFDRSIEMSSIRFDYRCWKICKIAG